MVAEARSSDDELVIERTFDAPRELVFAAWTESERLARWFVPRDGEIVVYRLEAKPGGTIHFAHFFAGDMVVRVQGAFREVVAPSRLAFSLAFVDADGQPCGPPGVAEWSPDAHVLTTVTFTERGRGTHMTMHQVMDLGGVAQTDAMREERSQAREGWIEMFDRLAELIAPGGGA